jgi:hypothetical protein
MLLMVFLILDLYHGGNCRSRRSSNNSVCVSVLSGFCNIVWLAVMPFILFTVQLWIYKVCAELLSPLPSCIDAFTYVFFFQKRIRLAPAFIGTPTRMET